MAHEFARHLSQFAKSVDSIDDNTFNSIKDMISDYFLESLEAAFFDVQIDGERMRIGDANFQALRTVLCSSADRTVISIFDANDQYNGQRSYAYDQNRALWIVTKDGGYLKNAQNGEGYLDYWANATDLPPYSDYGGGDARTSIIIPLKYGVRVFGVANLEFKEIVECSEFAKGELACVIDALARIIWLHQTTKNQRNDTRDAFSTLRESYALESSPLVKPTLFLASGEKADSKITGDIESVLKEFSDYVNVRNWQDDADPGTITEQIVNHIAECDYGVCYLSEPSKDVQKGQRYVDNLNVVFEAGMLHALKHDTKARPTNWIPIREGAPRWTDPPPFDFAAERMILVPRSDAGEVDHQEFQGRFRRSLESIMPDYASTRPDRAKQSGRDNQPRG